MASTQSEMDILHSEEEATYEETKPELERAVAAAFVDAGKLGESVIATAIEGR